MKQTSPMARYGLHGTLPSQQWQLLSCQATRKKTDHLCLKSVQKTSKHQSPNTLTFTYGRSTRGFNTVLLSHNHVYGFENETKEADNLAKLR